MTQPLTAYIATDADGQMSLMTLTRSEDASRRKLVYLYGDRDFEVLGWKVVKVEIKQVET